jgi:hypothetical protein
MDEYDDYAGTDVWVAEKSPRAATMSGMITLVACLVVASAEAVTIWLAANLTAWTSVPAWLVWATVVFPVGLPFCIIACTSVGWRGGGNRLLCLVGGFVLLVPIGSAVLSSWIASGG